MDDKWHFIIPLLAAVANDALDIFFVGSIPIAGDIIDLITLIVIIPFFGTKKLFEIFLAAAAFLAELIPGVDPFPTFTVAVILGWIVHAKFTKKEVKKEELNEKQETEDRRKVIHELAESLEQEKKEKKMTTPQIITWLVCIVAIVYMIIDVETACLAQWLAGTIIAIGIIVVIVVAIVGGTALVFLKAAVPKFGKFLLHAVIALLVIFGAALLICYYKDVLFTVYGPLIESLKVGISTISGTPTIPNIGG